MFRLNSSGACEPGLPPWCDAAARPTGGSPAWGQMLHFSTRQTLAQGYQRARAFALFRDVLAKAVAAVDRERAAHRPLPAFLFTRGQP